MSALQLKNRDLSGGARWQSGVTLIEVLVAIVVLSIGLLGMAGLQANGLKVGTSAIYRSQAAQAAYDIADRMMANQNQATAGSYSRSLGAANPTGTTLADQDMLDWLAIVRRLPSGDGAIASNGLVFTITVQWDDQRAIGRNTSTPGTAAPTQFVLVTQLTNR
jgi:type IV pilus assembly protein PilV